MGVHRLMSPIVLTEHGPPISAAYKFLSSLPAENSDASETPLLKAIKTFLRGTDADCSSSIKNARFFTGDQSKDHELSWNSKHAVLTYGGVIMKRWCFDHEGEAIQWACLGEIEQAVVPHAKSSHSAANYAMAEDFSTAPVQTGRNTFGPFHRANVEQAKKDESFLEVVPCVFVFLRSIGKMYLLNGMDYTFSLPFIVRKAWPVSPHGIIMQRVLEPAEVVEAEESGEEVLPTMFTLTSPFSEAAAVGHTAGILYADREKPAMLKDEEEHSKNPLRSIPPTQMIVWVSHCSAIADARVVVTVDVRNKLLSIWHYVYIKPKGLAFSQNPTEPTKTTERAKGKHRQSMSGVAPASRRTSALFDADRQRAHPISPGRTLPDPPTIPPEFFDLPDALPLAALPGMPPSLSTTATMASLVAGSSQKKGTTQPSRGRRNSLNRNDLTSPLDRMVLGGRSEDSAFLPVDHGRMKAAYWMECSFTHQISEEEFVLPVFLVLSLIPILVPRHGWIYQCRCLTIDSTESTNAASFPFAYHQANRLVCFPSPSRKIGRCKLCS